MKKLALLAAALVALSGLTSTATAQEQKQRGNFNPDEIRARMAERMRELLDVKNDDEWKLINARLEKVQEAQREVRALSGNFGLLFNRGGDQGGGGDKGGTRTRTGGTPGGGPGGFGGTPHPDAEALSKAVTAKAPSDEMKQKLARVREARKVAEGKYDKAADELRQVLTVRQEAVLVAVGLLK